MSTFRRYAPIGEGFSAAAGRDQNITGNWEFEDDIFLVQSSDSANVQLQHSGNYITYKPSSAGHIGASWFDSDDNRKMLVRVDSPERIRLMSEDDAGDNYITWYNAAETDRWGFFGFAGGVTDILYLRNEVASGEVYIEGHTAADSAVPLVHADPDGDVTLYNQGNKVFNTRSYGFDISGSAAGAPGSLQNTFMGLENSGGTRIGFIGYQQSFSDTFYIYSQNHGRPVSIAAEDAGGTFRAIMIADPDTNTQLYANGTERLRLNSNGVNFQNATTANTATAGAQTLPANPVAFLSVPINGVIRKIPYYAV